MCFVEKVNGVFFFYTPPYRGVEEEKRDRFINSGTGCRSRLYAMVPLGEQGQIRLPGLA